MLHLAATLYPEVILSWGLESASKHTEIVILDSSHTDRRSLALSLTSPFLRGGCRSRLASCMPRWYSGNRGRIKLKLNGMQPNGRPWGTARRHSTAPSRVTWSSGFSQGTCQVVIAQVCTTIPDVIWSARLRMAHYTDFHKP